MTRILLATSIAPNDIEKQISCVLSWSSAVHKCITINHIAEAEKLPAWTNDIQRVFVEESSIEVTGKPLVLIDSFLDTFKKSDYDALLIVNSDIHLRDARMMTKLFESAKDAFLFGIRTDVQGAPSFAENRFSWGFDYFYLNKAFAEAVPLTRFSIGSPFWDYWLPLFAIITGRNSILCTESLCTHQVHEQRWNEQWFRFFGQHLFERVLALIPSDDTGSDPLPTGNPLDICAFLKDTTLLFRDLIGTISSASSSPAELQQMDGQLLRRFAIACCKLIHTRSTIIGPSLSVK